jgi:LCP family protein required for cell wall assembly
MKLSVKYFVKVMNKFLSSLIVSQMRTKFILVLFVVLAFISGCNFPVGPITAPAAVSMNPNFLFSPSNATATATPFQPIPPTAVFYPTATPLPPTPVPTPRSTVSGSIVTAAGLIPQPKGQINVLILGSDTRSGGFGGRTDTIILATINPADNSINLTSFPRDLYVPIPGHGTNRINTAWVWGGFESLASTFEYNFGVRPDYYAIINFRYFTNLIDSLGGIDVNASQPLSEYTARGWFTVPAGITHMNGATALYYSRSRKSTSDFDRNRRQQEVITAVIDKMLNLYTITKIPEVYEAYVTSVSTNIKLKNIIPLIPVAARFSKDPKLRHYYIGRQQVASWVTPGGAQVLLPNQASILKKMRKALNSPE